MQKFKEVEVELILRYKETVDKDEKVTIKNFLVDKYKHLIYKIIWQRNQHNHLISVDDLFNSWVVWLLRALERFDNSKWNQFSTYCYFYIENEIRNFVDYNQFQINVERKVVQSSRKIAILREKWNSIEDIRWQIKLSDDLFKEAVKLQEMSENWDFISYESLLQWSADCENNFDITEEKQEDNWYEQQTLKIIKENLKEEEARVLILYLWLDWTYDFFENTIKISKQLWIKRTRCKEIVDNWLSILKQKLIL